MQMTTSKPQGNTVVFEDFKPPPSHAKEFGRHFLETMPKKVKLECTAGFMDLHSGTSSWFRWKRKESTALYVPLPEKGSHGPWDVVRDDGIQANILSFSVVVGQLGSKVKLDREPIRVITDPEMVKNAVLYAVNDYLGQLVLETPGTVPYSLTEGKIDLLKSACLGMNHEGDKARAIPHYAFRIPHAYGYVSEVAMQLTLNYALHDHGSHEFWVDVTEFRPGSTQIAKHGEAGPDCVIHAHQIALSAEIVKH